MSRLNTLNQLKEMCSSHISPIVSLAVWFETAHSFTNTPAVRKYYRWSDENSSQLGFGEKH